MCYSLPLHNLLFFTFLLLLIPFLFRVIYFIFSFFFCRSSSLLSSCLAQCRINIYTIQYRVLSLQTLSIPVSSSYVGPAFPFFTMHSSRNLVVYCISVHFFFPFFLSLADLLLVFIRSSSLKKKHPYSYSFTLFLSQPSPLAQNVSQCLSLALSLTQLVFLLFPISVTALPLLYYQK